MVVPTLVQLAVVVNVIGIGYDSVRWSQVVNRVSHSSRTQAGRNAVLRVTGEQI